MARPLLLPGKSRRRDSRIIAALYVESRGVYAGLPDVDLWDRDRDARTYAGPWPVVAHPPGARWGRSWGGHPTQQPRLVLGDDVGMLRRGPGRDAPARRCLGAPRGQPCVDRPSDSSRHHREPEGGRDGLAGGVDVLRGKGHYGHRSRKTTGWYAVGGALPGSGVGRAQRPVRSRRGDHSAADRWRAIKMEACQRLSHRERNATPELFRDLLIAMAGTVKMKSETG